MGPNACRDPRLSPHYLDCRCSALIYCLSTGFLCFFVFLSCFLVANFTYFDFTDSHYILRLHRFTLYTSTSPIHIIYFDFTDSHYIIRLHRFTLYNSTSPIHIIYFDFTDSHHFLRLHRFTLYNSTSPIHIIYFNFSISHGTWHDWSPCQNVFVIVSLGQHVPLCPQVSMSLRARAS